MTEKPHTFAANPLDRGEALRRDEDRIASLQGHTETKFLLFNKLKVASSSSQLLWHSTEQINEMTIGQTVFLGTHEGSALFAATTDAPDLEFADCRLIAGGLTTPETGILAQARAQLDWHYRNPYCAQCGNPTHAQRGGQIRRCDTCERHIFPRTDPVALVLIVDQAGGDRCLLGKPLGRFANTNFYTALAGFIDQGESIEDGVRREVQEEAGITVGKVQYHSSQPWPFPSQLMIGCHGIATDHDIQIDPEEMADVQWFTREQTIAGLEERGDDLRVPGPMAIAHHLIRSWAYGEVSV